MFRRTSSGVRRLAFCVWRFRGPFCVLRFRLDAAVIHRFHDFSSSPTRCRGRRHRRCRGIARGAGVAGLHARRHHGLVGIRFTHNNGAFGRKYLPETLGSGAAFLDYDNDGWQDMLLVNGTDWPGRSAAAGTPSRLYRNDGRRPLHGRDEGGRLDIDCTGWASPSADFDNDGWPDVLVTAVGQSRLFRNTGRGTFVDVTVAAASAAAGFSTSALWFDYDRDGLLDLFVVQLRQVDAGHGRLLQRGRQAEDPTARPRPTAAATSWLFRNRGTAPSKTSPPRRGLFDSTSKSLGVTLLDYDLDGWPDVFVANDTQPNKLYRNSGNGTFTEIGLAGRPGVQRGRPGARRHGRRRRRRRQHRHAVGRRHQLLGRDARACTSRSGGGQYADGRRAPTSGAPRRHTLGFGCFFFDVDLDGLLRTCSSSTATSTTRSARRRHGSPTRSRRTCSATRAGAGSATWRRRWAARSPQPKVGRGAAFADVDGDGDLDVLITTNGGPAYLYRNDVAERPHRDPLHASRDEIEPRCHRRPRARLRGRHDVARAHGEDGLELPVAVGTAALLRPRPPHQGERVVIEWPSGGKLELSALDGGVAYEVTEGQGITARRPLGKTGLQPSALGPRS